MLPGKEGPTRDLVVVPRSLDWIRYTWSRHVNAFQACKQSTHWHVKRTVSVGVRRVRDSMCKRRMIRFELTADLSTSRLRAGPWFGTVLLLLEDLHTEADLRSISSSIPLKLKNPKP